MRTSYALKNLFVPLALTWLTAVLALDAGSTAVSSDPQADALLARHLDAVGGATALQKITSRRITGTLERHGTRIPIVRVQKGPNQLLVETRFPRPGTLKQGFDGSTGWIQHPLQGSRRLEGKELAALADEAWLHPALRMRDQFPVRQFLGARTNEARQLMALSLSRSKRDQPETWFLDKTTALLARLERQVDGGSQGAIPVSIVFEDYRKVDGILIPFTIRTILPTSETVLRMDSITHNLQFDDSTFQAPF